MIVYQRLGNRPQSVSTIDMQTGSRSRAKSPIARSSNGGLIVPASTPAIVHRELIIMHVARRVAVVRRERKRRPRLSHSPPRARAPDYPPKAIIRESPENQFCLLPSLSKF
jgi:hypothetical protein